MRGITTTTTITGIVFGIIFSLLSFSCSAELITAAGQSSGGGSLASLGIYMGVRQDAAGNVIGGTSYAAGDVVTVAGGTCVTQPTLVLWSAGAAPIFSVSNPGKCSVLPSDPETLTGGSGSGGTVALSGLWGPLAADVSAASFIPTGSNGPVFYPPSLGKSELNPSIGNQCFGNPGACGGNGNGGDGLGGGTGLTGAENTFMGYLTGAQVTSGTFLTFMGHNAGGHETTGQSGVCIGEDSCKWTTGMGSVANVGNNSGKFIISPNGVTAIGTNAALGGNFSSSITGAVSNGGACQITVSSATGMATGDTTVVTGVLGATGCNGVWTNVTVSGSTITLTGSTFGGSYTSGGLANDFATVGLSSVVAIGNNALDNSGLRSTGSIVAIGSGVATALTTANHAVIMGSNAGTGITTGSSSTIVGDGAGQALTAGSVYVVIGASANPAANGSSGVIIGN